MDRFEVGNPVLQHVPILRSHLMPQRHDAALIRLAATATESHRGGSMAARIACLLTLPLPSRAHARDSGTRAR